MKRIIFKGIGVLVLIVLFFVLKDAYQMHIKHNFDPITEGKVYKSGVIPPNEIKEYIESHKIKTVIDFRHGEIGDELNPANLNEIEKEKLAVDAIQGVNYVHIPSVQIPSEDNLAEFFKVLDDSDSYPVLMHCHHGTGRAMIYSAIYRIEYEDQSNEEARKQTRPFFSLPFSSFAEDKPKGKYLEEYEKRKK